MATARQIAVATQTVNSDFRNLMGKAPTADMASLSSIGFITFIYPTPTPHNTNLWPWHYYIHFSTHQEQLGPLLVTLGFEEFNYKRADPGSSLFFEFYYDSEQDQ